MRAPKDGFDTRSGVGFGRNASHILSRCKVPSLTAGARRARVSELCFTRKRQTRGA